MHSNIAIADALAQAGAPEHAIQLIPFTDRESVAVLAGMDKWLDLIIPRGGKGLIETVVSLARMPVIKHYDDSFLPKVAAALRTKNVELRGCDETRKHLTDILPATEEDWSTEYLDLILSIKIVGSLEEAVAHINQYGSHHTDVIVTTDHLAAERFLREVDSACVFHNVSTRFADGGEFGFGAEIGISTDKLHARGPMGLRELTSYQYRVRGNGQVKG